MTELVFDKKGKNPLFALDCFVQGFKYLMKPELRSFVIIPVIINIILYSAAFFVSTYYISLMLEEFIPSWLDWLNWLLWPLFFLCFMIIGFFSFTLLANLIAAPFYGKLAARALAIASDKQVLVVEQSVSKVLKSELKRLLYILLRTLPLVLISIVPGLNVIAPFLWLVFGAWCLVMEYMAYPLENEGLLFAEQREKIKSVRFGSLSFGGLVVLGLAVPILNIVVPPAAVIGATVFSYKAK